MSDPATRAVRHDDEPLASTELDDSETAAAPDDTTDGSAASDTATDTEPDDERWWRGDRSVMIAAAIVALGFVLMIRGVLLGVTGDDRNPLPDAIESINPVPDAVQVLSQTNVFVDLAPGYTGEFVIDGVAIDTVNIDQLGSVTVEPGQQLDLPPVTIYEPGNATLTFTPSSGAPISEFLEGEHQVVLRYWLIDEGPARSTIYRWTFSTF